MASIEHVKSDQQVLNPGPEKRPTEIADAVEGLASRGGAEERGAVFTKREVVEFILDLVGYTADRPLHEMRILEPSFGGGDFLFPVLDRLIEAWKKSGSKLETLKDALRAVELHRASADSTKERLRVHLQESGFPNNETRWLVEQWIVQDDFLLAHLEGTFDFVVGNPPYVRQENIPKPLLQEYRRRFSTVYDRADLYVPFIERSLLALGEGGTLGFICSDRWMKNKYGGPLRRLVHEHFHLRTHVDMVDTDAFLSEVTAYPAITVLERGGKGPTGVTRHPRIETCHLQDLARRLRAQEGVETISEVTDGANPWLVDFPRALSLLRRIESRFPAIEDSGCRVGIGVATGADRDFIGLYSEMDVEESRKLPLVQRKDLKDGEVTWSGGGVLNPFSQQGGLVDLDEYPRLRAYLEERKDRIAGRHCAKKNPDSWYRTIDKIDPALTERPKLLIPDIKGATSVAYEPGKLYPHHNLYYVVSEEWDLRALQAVLLSSVTLSFIAAYSTRMRGGSLRFQAQYIRRLRLPKWESVQDDLRKRLIAAGRSGDMGTCDDIVFELYNLTKAESKVMMEVAGQ